MAQVPKLMLVLTTTCFAAALALSQVYELTKEPIAYQKRLEVLRAIRAVLSDIDNEPDKDLVRLPFSKAPGSESKEITFFRGRSGGKLTGVAFVVESREGYGGTIEVMLGLDTQGTILGVEILGHLETPGLGNKIIEKPFRQQFVGRNLTNTKWAVRKDGGDIDQITGATISPRAVVQAIKTGLEAFRERSTEVLQ